MQTPEHSIEDYARLADEQLRETDDFASAWAERQAEGKAWGGRGHGGRGVNRQYQCMSTRSRDVHVENVTLAYQNRDLLTATTLKITHGHRYALLGRNGVGKTTLLRRISSGDLPGFPPHLRVASVAQERSAASTTRTALEEVLERAFRPRERDLHEEAAVLETELEEFEPEDDNAVTIAQRLGEIDDELEELSGDRIVENARQVLKGLGFSKTMLNAIVSTLSGGWRMRLSLAVALLIKPDILLLDEPTNHLDLHGVLWLERFLTEQGEQGQTLVVVSHDQAFVSAVATDVIMFENQTLRYFNGTFDDFEQREAEAATRQEHMLDARIRQEKSAREAAEKMKASAAKAKKGSNDKQLKQAKQKLNKIERIGLYTENGKRFKLMSLQKLDEKFLRLPSRVEAKREHREDAFDFPSPDIQSLRAKSDSLISMERVVAGYPVARGGAANPVVADGGADGDTNVVLSDLTCQIGLRSRIALVGANGAGKSTLLKLILGELTPLSGAVSCHPNLRLAFVPQHHTDELAGSLHLSATQFIVNKFGVSELEARSRLGKFSLKGKDALGPLGTLSGGQKTRVCLTSVTWNSPHVLVLDEPTNHLDASALRSLAIALRDFDGGVVLVSHNRAFCGAFCRDLWVLENGRVTQHHGSGADEGDEGEEDKTPFSELFSSYSDGVMSKAMSGGSRGNVALARRDARNKSSAMQLDRAATGGGSKRGGAGKIGKGAGAARAALM